MIYSVDVRIEVPVRDTEVTDRVFDAVRNVFPDAEPVHEDGSLVAEAHTLDAFSDVLHEQEILDTARRVFLRNSTDEGFAFSLKKQAAFEGVVNFAVGEPDELGEIDVDVRVREPDVESFIDYVAPETDEGRPVDPVREYGDRVEPDEGDY
ncbi:coaE operon protein [Halorubrum sp. Ib24]|uniref:RNA-binding domain-containing protein n=1 Tax=unclassified Halorubrum TaxID=2642239 RepID=UPI000B992B83|nr:MULTISPECIES: RNA-binding domain-containing protein [unclassified Halorubrum]OYR37925.1 coaE operon protein [Halorubrum sp. Ib24]OYR39192.1 coaE operon protein [Halorubrum sp. Eb13]OYR47907.1 coaE operon protein [Halorubrum sp. Ea8]OYR53110.1 coaE operon protein [Halorubrum sp. Ea1]